MTTYIDPLAFVQSHGVPEHFDVDVTRVCHVRVAMTTLALGQHPEVG